MRPPACGIPPQYAIFFFNVAIHGLLIYGDKDHEFRSVRIILGNFNSLPAIPYDCVNTVVLSIVQ